ncbi:4'-phosphopantetheinyl transferase family protein [Streptomyces sp. NPDC055103]
MSLSHSSGWVAAAVGRNRDVGVDVQTPAPVGDRLLRFCCSPDDADALSALPEARRRRELASGGCSDRWAPVAVADREPVEHQDNRSGNERAA